MNIYLIQSQSNEAKRYFDYIEMCPLANGNIYIKAAIQAATRQYYIVSIFFPDKYPNEMPTVHITKPLIESAPHRYTAGHICYLHPSMWNPGKHDVLFVIKRAAKWLGKYEVWKQEGRWPGAGLKH